MRPIRLIAASILLAVMVFAIAVAPDHSPPTRLDYRATSAATPPGPDGSTFPAALQAQESRLSSFYAAVQASYWHDVTVWVASLPKPNPPPPPMKPRAPSPRAASPSPNHGPHSDAWWHGVAICEQGGRNDPYFGYFSVMNGSAGGKSWAEQIVIVNAIIAKYGDGAWAASCVRAGYNAAPGG